MMNIKLVVLDMAGTVVKNNNEVARAFIEAFLKFGFDVTEGMVNPLMGYKKTTAIKMVLDQLQVKSNEQLINKIHESFEKEMLQFYRTSPDVVAAPNAESTMRILKNHGIHVALNTGFPKSIADAIVLRFGWIDNGFVDEYIASDEVEAGRPDPAMIRELMKRTYVNDSRQVFKVGDTPVDILEGRRANCGQVVAVTTGASSREELETEKPDFIIDDLVQLPLIIGLATNVPAQ